MWSCMRTFAAVFGARPVLAARTLQYTGHPIWPAVASFQILTLEHSIATIAAAQSITSVSHPLLHAARAASTTTDQRLADAPKAHHARTYTLQVLRLGHARELDLRKLRDHKALEGLWRLALGEDMVLIALDDRARTNSAMPVSEKEGLKKMLPPYPYLMAMNFGSVVLVDVRDDGMRSTALQAVADCTDKPQQVNEAMVSEFEDDYYISESKGHGNKPRVVDDTVLIDTLDLEYLSTVCRLTGMSVALMYWDKIVEKLLSKLYEINKDAETSGKFDRLYDRSKLVEMVAQVNIISTNMLHRLRVLDKHKYAWRDEDVDSLWGKLAYELDLGQRYDSLTSKLDLLKDSLRYYLELAHNRKSYSVEFSIVLLIAFEIALQMYQTYVYGIA